MAPVASPALTATLVGLIATIRAPMYPSAAEPQLLRSPDPWGCVNALARLALLGSSVSDVPMGTATTRRVSTSAVTRMLAAMVAGWLSLVRSPRAFARRASVASPDVFATPARQGSRTIRDALIDARYQRPVVLMLSLLRVLQATACASALPATLDPRVQAARQDTRGRRASTPAQALP